MTDQAKARLDIVALLLLHFALYVVGDTSMTFWLILNDPYGVLHEANPIGRALYLSQGLTGLILGKMMIFVPLSVMVLSFEAKYRNIRWFREVVETVVLGQITYSLIVFLNNFAAIIAVQFFRGATYILQMFPVIKMLIIILSTCLTVVFLQLRGYGGSRRATEVVLGTAVTAGPLLLFDPLFTYLGENIWLLLAYTASVLAILGAFFFMAEEIRRDRLGYKLTVQKRVSQK